MATDEGAMGRRGRGEDRLRQRRRPPPIAQPSELHKDMPWPPTYERNLGPGGEEIDDGLVSIERGAAMSEDASNTDRRRRAHTLRGRVPVPRLVRSGWASLAVCVAGGLAALAVLATLVTSDHRGPPPPRSDERAAVALDAPELIGSSRQDWISASRELNARVRESAERRRDAASERHRRARLAERREREERRRIAPRAPAPVEATQVAETPNAPAPPADPWPNVSPAERALTPGPWNLS